MHISNSHATKYHFNCMKNVICILDCHGINEIIHANSFIIHHLLSQVYPTELYPTLTQDTVQLFVPLFAATAGGYQSKLSI